MILKFTVYGKAVSKGSTQPFMGKGGRVIPQNLSKLQTWTGMIAAEAAKVMDGRELCTGPVSMIVEFFFQRPKSHFGTGRNSGNLKPSAPREHVQKPDLSKLIRAAEDALSGIVYRDDSQVYRFGARTGKYWTTQQERAEFAIETQQNNDI